MDIIKPTLLVNKKKCLRNIKRMLDKANMNNLIFRPHFKTHQSTEVGKWFREFGVEKITVSSVDMAQYFADNGFSDITIAFPVNILEIEKINYLCGKIKLNILLESENAVDFLTKNLKYKTGIYIKIDCGYHRTGIEDEDFDTIKAILHKISKAENMMFRGFLVHSGNTYDAKSSYEIQSIHNESLKKLNHLKNEFKKEFPDIILSIGDTPSCSLMDDFKNVDEVRPGNFVFYDVMQAELGSCSYNDIAVAVVCPVVAKHKKRNEIVIYGGAVHLSKDLIKKDGVSIYGLISNFDGEKWSAPIQNTYIKKLSQEHGIIKTTPDYFEKIKEGELIAVLPVHSCLTVDAMCSELVFIRG